MLADLEFKLCNLENAAIRVHALYNSLWWIRLIYYSLASTPTFLLLHFLSFVILLNSIIGYVFGWDPRLTSLSVIPPHRTKNISFLFCILLFKISLIGYQSASVLSSLIGDDGLSNVDFGTILCLLKKASRSSLNFLSRLA